uniref:Uncharacterized protein n=1 Tax=Triticum urartu TaxID=4572 RepID=A0A8R7K0Y6_TRIUA
HSFFPPRVESPSPSLSFLVLSDELWSASHHHGPGRSASRHHRGSPTTTIFSSDVANGGHGLLASRGKPWPSLSSSSSLGEVECMYPVSLEMAPTMRVDGGAGTAQQRHYDGMAEMLHSLSVKLHLSTAAL